MPRFGGRFPVRLGPWARHIRRAQHVPQARQGRQGGWKQWVRWGWWGRWVRWSPFAAVAAALFWLALAAGVALAQEVPGPVEAPIDACELSPDDPGCRLLTDEEFDAMVGPDAASAPQEADRWADRWADTWEDGSEDGLASPQSRHMLGVPRLSQWDSRWRGHVMQSCGLTIGTHGCALTSATMVIRYFGSSQLPPGLNECLGSAACPIYWPVVPGCSQGRAVWVGSRSFSYSDLRALVNTGRPPILKVKHGGHWVVVVGYDDPMPGEGWENPYLFLINDPADGQLKRLSEYDGYGDIRIYQRASG